MGRTKQAQYTLYLGKAVAAKFEVLAAKTRISKATLLREAVDDLLKKFAKKARK
jgi:hypothetical protein